MTKRLLIALFVTLISLVQAGADGYVYNYNHLWFEIIDYDSRSLKFRGFDQSYVDSILIIPETIMINDKRFGEYEIDYNENNYQGKLYVTELGEFDDCGILTAIKLPSTLKTIAKSAFNYKRRLKKLVIPPNVESIGASAFLFCDSLEEIDMRCKATEIPLRAFGYCYSLKKVLLPENLRTIGEQSFSFCTSLTEIELPDSLNTMHEAAFYHSGLTSIKIPDGVTYIPNFAFDYCNNLTKIEISPNTRKIGDYAFSKTSIENIELSEKLDSVGIGTFSMCENLQSVVFPESVTYLGGYLFYDCDNLSHVTLPSNITEIADYTFFYCGLSELEIPRKVRKIGKYALSDNGRLFGVFTDIQLPDSLECIGEGAFWMCIYLTEITIPDKVETIGYGAFERCDYLSAVKLGRGLKKIEDKAFLLCNLQYIECTGETPPEMGYKVFDESAYDTATLVVPDNAVDNYANFNSWEDFFDIKTKTEAENGQGAIREIDAEGISIHGTDGRIRVNGAEGQLMQVYNLAGSCIYSGDCGETGFVGKGIYIVRIGMNNYKVCVR